MLGERLLTLKAEVWAGRLADCDAVLVTGDSALRCRVGREGQKGGGSCARVFSGKVPLPLGKKSLAGLKVVSKHSQLLSLGISQKSWI